MWGGITEVKRVAMAAVLWAGVVVAGGDGEPSADAAARRRRPPPNAWVGIGDAGSVRLFRGSFCWNITCADFVNFDDAPRIQVAKGTRLTFRLKFKPEDVFLQDLERDRVVKRITPRRKFSWTVKRSSLYDIFVRDAKDRGDVSYVFKLRVW
jgi:hypothetical protein